MADGVQFRLEGIDELQKKLKFVSDDMDRKSGRFALRKAANVIRDQVEANALKLDDPATANSIAENASVRWSGKSYKRFKVMKFRIGILGGARQYANTKANARAGRAGETYLTGGDKGNPGGDTWYWRLLEFGTEKMGAQPFIRPAGQQSARAAVKEFATQYSKAIDRKLKKLNKG